MAARRIAAQPNPQRTIETQLRTALAAQRQIVTDMTAYLALTPAQQATQAQTQIVRLSQATRAQSQSLIGLCRIVGKQLDAST